MPTRGEAPDMEVLQLLIRQLVPEWRAEDLHDFSYLPAGYSNDNYRFRHGDDRYVLRLPLGTRSRAEWREERAFYRSPGTVLVPEVLAFDVGSGAMISRWIDGALLIDAPPAPDRLAAFLRAMHRGLAAASNCYDPVARSKRYLATPGPEQPSPRIEALLERLQWPNIDACPCHNDFNPWNVIRSANDRWVTLDWEWRANNDPLFDLVTMHQGLGLADELLPGLCAELLGEPATARRIECVLMGFWAREYAWAFAAWQSGNRRDELRRQMALAEEKLAGLDS